ncbi:MAG: adenylyl-sulfate kinase [Lentisphaerae bacterium]|nr:adenylyl-sulfate kinase [Lentisphaerota bacterium]
MSSADAYRRIPGMTPCVVWFTGLSGSGKSTIAERLVALLSEQGDNVEHLDGDRVREVFPGTGFSRRDRNEHLRRIGFLAGLLERHGVIVVATFVSPYRESRAAARAMCRRFIEVHVSTPLEVCEKRDVKGLYARARRGEIPNLTGVGDVYEPPESPELEINAADVPVEESCRRIIEAISTR